MKMKYQQNNKLKRNLKKKNVPSIPCVSLLKLALVTGWCEITKKSQFHCINVLQLQL